VLHVHTTLSDGGGTPEEVVAAARAAGLAFVAITDHNNLDAKWAEGYRDGVLTIVGSELSTTAGHLLALGIPDPVFRFSGDALDGLDDVRALGGAAFAAHPLSPRADFAWTGWDLPGAWGVELINGDSQWREAGWLDLLKTGALYTVNRREALLESLTPPAAALARWDVLLASRDVAGLAGADAHSRVPVTRRFALRFPSYASLFGLLRNHVLLRQPLSGVAAEDVRSIVEALRDGHNYVGLDGLAPAGGFGFTAETGGARYTMGDTVPSAAPLRLRAGGRLPRGSRVRLLRDGRLLAEAERALERTATESGVYRVEVAAPGRSIPFILSNPIYVFSDGEAAARRRRAAWPDEPPLPAARLLLDSFEAGTGFAREFDPSSAMPGELLAPRLGAGGSSAANLAFRLGRPEPGRPYTWCALVNREPRDLSGYAGLVFSLRADGEYRLWVQVRDANPASADAGEEWWFASVRTATEWRRLAVPFARLRSLNPKTDGRLDLDKVRGLVFVLDHAAVKPGSAGRIWLDELGAY
jgi:hypothetical protein